MVERPNQKPDDSKRIDTKGSRGHIRHARPLWGRGGEISPGLKRIFERTVVEPRRK